MRITSSDDAHNTKPSKCPATGHANGRRPIESGALVGVNPPAYLAAACFGAADSLHLVSLASEIGPRSATNLVNGPNSLAAAWQADRAVAREVSLTLLQ